MPWGWGVIRDDVTLPQDASFRDYLIALCSVSPFLGHVMVFDLQSRSTKLLGLRDALSDELRPVLTITIAKNVHR